MEVLEVAEEVYPMQVFLEEAEQAEDHHLLAKVDFKLICFLIIYIYK